MFDLRVGRFVIPARELRVRFTRSSGPGGQNVNKRATRAEIVFDLEASDAIPESAKRRARARLGGRLDASGRVRVTSDAARTQAENRARALERLGALLGEALRPPPKPRAPTKPTAGSRERRLAAKRVRGQRKRERRAPAADD